ncbi:MAG TPA: hypothetical protein VGF67_02710 [Ktedonobacteraceae bacterium]|jgi:hypothetical protein
MGEAVEAVQQAPTQESRPVGVVPARLIVSPDGAMVPLGGGEWAEVKTVVVGEEVVEEREQEPHRIHLSYFSRLANAQTFTEQASGEWLRRGVDQAKQVCAVMDGAEWIDGFLDWQCPNTWRVLDFAHAAEYVNAIGQLAQADGSLLPPHWVSKQLPELKRQGPCTLLAEVRRLRERHQSEEDLSKTVASLEKREARRQYPQYQADHWPIGSGCVERGKKVVMQARLKGAGMHWEPAHVNPMLALRTSACHDRWDEAIGQARSHLGTLRLDTRRAHQRWRYEQRLRPLLVHLWMLTSRSRSSAPAPSETVSLRHGPSRPSAPHPWRKPLLAKK